MVRFFRVTNRLSLIISPLFLLFSGTALSQETVTLSTEVLRDKIKGGWAAQTIGVTYGFPVEFRFNSERVPDDHELRWYDGLLYETFTERPGAYDDIYMDLSFVQVFEDEGLDAAVESLAESLRCNKILHYDIATKKSVITRLQ